MHKISLRNDLIFSAGLFLLAMLFYSVVAFSENFLPLPNAYQARDINRALDLVFNHKWIWYGPDLSGGGQLPGPFYYWLIGIPLSIFNSVQSVFYFEYALASLGLSLACCHLRRLYSGTSAILFFLMFLNSPFFVSQLNWFWNPSFLFIFVALVWLLLAEKITANRLAASAFLVGLATQIHFSAMLLLIPALLAVFFDSTVTRRTKLLNLSAIAGFFLLPLIPPFIAKFFVETPSGIYYSADAGVTRFFWRIKFLLTHAENHIEPGKLRWLLSIISREVYLLPGLVAFFIFRKEFRLKSPFTYYAVATSMAGLIILFFGMMHVRYIIPLIWVMALMSAICIPQLFKMKPLLGYLFAVYVAIIYFLDSHGAQVAVLLVFAAWFALSATRPSHLKWPGIFLVMTFINLAVPSSLPENAVYYDGSEMSTSKARKILSEVVASTGWDYTHFREHTVITGFSEEIDLALVYNSVYAEKGKIPGLGFDGLIMRNGAKEAPYTTDIEKAFAEHEIECGKTVLIESAHLCFYRFTDRKKIRRMNNIGYGYVFSQKPVFKVSDGRGVFKKGPLDAVFYINSCASLEEACSVFFTVTLTDNSGLKLTATGDPLGVAYSQQNPAWGWSIEKPLLRVRCGKKISDIEIAHGLGFSGSGSRDTLNAPFDGYYALPCSQPDAITLLILKSQSFLAYRSSDNAVWDIERVELTWEPNQR